jgi:hypothetical protein
MSDPRRAKPEDNDKREDLEPFNGGSGDPPKPPKPELPKPPAS